MSFLARISILVLCIVTATLFVLPFVFDNSLLKLQLEQKISQNLGSNFYIKGNVDVSFIPLPRVIVHDANISNLQKGDLVVNLNVKKLKINPSIFSLFGKVKINKLIFEYPTMTVSRSAKGVDKVGGKVKLLPDSNDGGTARLSDKIFDFRESSAQIFNLRNIDKIEIENGILIQKDFYGKTSLEFKEVELTVINDIEEQIFDINGMFSSDGIPTAINVKLDVNKGQDSEIVIHSPIINIVIYGKFSDSNISDLLRSNFSGKFDAEIIDLKAVLNQYFSKTNLIYRKINTTKTIKLSADIQGVKGEINIKNIVINSELMTGDGTIEANFLKPKPIIDVDLTFNNFDIDDIWLSRVKINDQNIVALEKDMVGNFLGNGSSAKNIRNITSPTLRNLDLTAEIKIKQARYMNGDLKDVNLYFIMSEKGEILLQPLSFKIAGAGEFKMSGAFDNDNNIPRFVGKVDLSGKSLRELLSWVKMESDNLKEGGLYDYKMMADMLISPNFIILSNLDANINDGKNVIDGSVKYDISSNLSIIDLKINNLNIDDYFDTSKNSKYLSRGSLLKKILWLNTINLNKDFILNFGKLSYSGNDFYDQTIKFGFGQGYFKIDQIDIKSDDLDIDGSIKVDISKGSPILELELNIDKLVYKTSAKNHSAEHKFIDKLFNLPSLASFNGNIAIKAKDVLIEGLKMDNFQANGGLDGGKLTLESCVSAIYGGELVCNGSVSFRSSKSVSGTFELTNIDNREFLKNIFGINNVSGISNISGVANSFGKDKKDFVNNIDIQANFISGNVLIRGFGIDSLSRKMFHISRYKNELKNPFDILFNKDEVSLLKSVNGQLDIRRNGARNILRIESESPGVNSLTTGSLNLSNQSVEASSNIIFTTGSRQNYIHLTIAVSYSGKFGNLSITPNLTQVEDYLRNKIVTE